MKHHKWNQIINEDLKFRLFYVEKNNFVLGLYELVLPFSLQIVDSPLIK